MQHSGVGEQAGDVRERRFKFKRKRNSETGYFSMDGVPLRPPGGPTRFIGSWTWGEAVAFLTRFRDDQVLETEVEHQVREKRREICDIWLVRIFVSSYKAEFRHHLPPGVHVERRAQATA